MTAVKIKEVNPQVMLMADEVETAYASGVEFVLHDNRERGPWFNPDGSVSCHSADIPGIEGMIAEARAGRLDIPVWCL